MTEAVCSKKYLIKFQKLLKEVECFIIRKPSLGDNMNPYKILNHPYKVHLHWGSTVVKCMDFRGTQYGFSFSPFEQLIHNSVADNTILGDNSTPFSENDATTAMTVHRNGNSQHSFTNDLKRNLEDVYDVDDSPCQSVSRLRFRSLVNGPTTAMSRMH
ncbi:hypothetical protein R6Q57_029818 [Mikania cordata]